MTQIEGRKVLLTGGGGFLGRRLIAELEDRGAKVQVVRSAEFDLTEPDQVKRALDSFDPELIVHAAAVVGGIGANREHPGRFFYANAVMGIHLIHESMLRDIEKMVIVGTVCAYPKFTPVPFSEDDIWDGYPEETNAPYGLAKKMLLVQSQAYRAEYGFNSAYVIPTNLYGPNDNFDLNTSHVIPAMIRKFIEAKEAGEDTVTLWGTGAPSREFLYVDDAADGIITALERYDGAEPVNLGSDNEVRIADLAHIISEATGFDGGILWDDSKPDGQPRRAVDGARAEQTMGWRAKVKLEEGIQRTVDWFVEHRAEAREVVFD